MLSAGRKVVVNDSGSIGSESRVVCSDKVDSGCNLKKVHGMSLQPFVQDQSCAQQQYIRLQVVHTPTHL